MKAPTKAPTSPTNSPTGVGETWAPTSSPTLPPGWKHAPTCQHGGSAVTCGDGVRNGNEAMADCGGGCARNQTEQCAAEAAAAVASLNASTTAHPGKFEVLLPSNITGWAGPMMEKKVDDGTHKYKVVIEPKALSVRARQKLVVTCVASVRPCTRVAPTPPRLFALGKDDTRTEARARARDSTLF